MKPKPLPDRPEILEALFGEAKRYLEEFGPIANNLLILERKKLDGDASLLQPPWDLDYQKALIHDIYKRLATSSGGLIALGDYFERDLFADFEDVRSRMGGVDPNSNPSMTTVLYLHQTLDKIRVLYRNIIAKLEEQKTPSYDSPSSSTPRSRHPIQGGHSPNGQSALTLQSEISEVEASEQLTPAVAKAYQSFVHAMELAPFLKTDKNVYKWIKEHGLPDDDYRLPAFETWSRYVRLGRGIRETRKNRPRRGRGHGKSIIQLNEPRRKWIKSDE